MPSEPIVQLEPNGKASILSYNVPEPVSYTGTSIIALDVPTDWFRQTPGIGKAVDSKSAKQESKPSPLLGRTVAISNNAKAWALASSLDPTASTRMILASDVTNFKTAEATSDHIFVPARTIMPNIDVLYAVPASPAVRPRLFFREKYRLSTFLGQYGAGRTVKTFSLLPGEKTKISVTSYLKSTTTAKQASSILDSVTDTSATEFQETLADEESDKQNSADSLEWHVEAEASAHWGWGSAKVSGGVKGASSSAREQFAKRMSSATSKHAATASAKRDVQVNTSYESSTETGESTSVERIIENINVSRTLNFVFRQMNQEFVTILHLVDIEVGFFNGQKGSSRIKPLYALADLIDEVIGDAPGNDPGARRAQVEAWFMQELDALLDWKGTPVNAAATTFVEVATPKDASGKPMTPYLRVNRNFISDWKNAATGFEVSVPGVILSADINVMRTEGLIVEALLGQGNALDEYSSNLQTTAVRERQLENEKIEAALAAIANGDAEKAKLYALMFPVVQVKAPEAHQ
ncbi:hypothetical protein [Rhizobium sp. GCM10022189]|uniref:hypothetical protein n=1 Tax=Rhizobium sp. GCM10022189 TaxID=3252654 RepID=UPI003608218D